jgi:hypothetical protein
MLRRVVGGENSCHVRGRGYVRVCVHPLLESRQNVVVGNVIRAQVKRVFQSFFSYFLVSGLSFLQGDVSAN